MVEDLNIHDYNIGEEEKEIDRQLRPQRFEDFNGQDKIVDNLRVFVKAARIRN